MKKQKLLLGILVFVLIANFIIPNVVLATDELLTEEENVQEEVLVGEETELVEDEATTEEVPAEISETHYSDGIYYDGNYITEQTDVIAMMDEKQTFYLPAELAEPGTDTRILQSLFLLDEVGNIAATKKITTLNYGRPYEGATYRLMEDEEVQLFRVTPIDANGNYSTTPSSYKIEFIYIGQDYVDDFTMEFNYHNEHKGYGKVYNEETDAYDTYSYFNIYTNLNVHFVKNGKKANIYKYETVEASMRIYLHFDKNNQCVLTHTGHTADFAQALQEYFYMYLPEEGDYTVYATIDEELNALVEVENEDEAMFKFYIDNALGVYDTDFTMTIDWLKDNTEDVTVVADQIETLSYTRNEETENANITTIVSQICYNVPIDFFSYKKAYQFEDSTTEKGTKEIYINFDENGTVTLPYDLSEDWFNKCDAGYVHNMLNMYGENSELAYLDYDGKTWTVSYTQTENSYVKVTGTNITGSTESVAYDITLEILKDLPENRTYSVNEYYDIVGVDRREDDENIYITQNYDLYDTISIVLVPYEKDVNYYLENAEVDNDNSTAMFEFSMDYSKFLDNGKVFLDGILLKADEYTSRAGSTIIELGKELLNSLSIGLHTLKVEVDDGYAEAQFAIEGENELEVVVDNEVDQVIEENPNTGDYAPIMVVLFLVSALGIAYAQRKLVVNKK